MINLGFDFFPLQVLNTGHIDFVVEVTDVANDCLVFHTLHMLARNDMVVTGSRYEHVGLVASLFHGDHFVAFHRRLQRTNGIDFRYPHLGTQRRQRLGTPLAYITKTHNHGHFACNHHVGCTLDTVNQRLPATIKVVELGLGD